jgi:5'(3')-deoxyribonucleotidase
MSGLEDEVLKNGINRLRIGLDIDSVIADTQKSWAAYIKSQDGVCHTAREGFSYDAKPDGWDYWTAICDTCFDHVLHNRERCMELELHEGALGVINNLSKFCDLYVLTSRPEVIHKHTIAWLEKKGIYQHIQEAIFSHDKEEDCNRLDLHYHLDDSPRQLEAIGSKSNTQALIFDTDYNKEVLGIRFYNWQQVLRYLSAANTIRKFELGSHAP